MQSMSVLLYILKGYITWFIYFLDTLYVRYNCAKFYHCRISVTDFREMGPFYTHPWAAQKRPIINRFKQTESGIVYLTSLHKLVVKWREFTFALSSISNMRNNSSFMLVPWVFNKGDKMVLAILICLSHAPPISHKCRKF